jgi:hypothetical protein
MLGKLGDLIGGAGQSQFAEQGSSVLGNLLGGGSMGALASAASKFTGMGDGATKSLIGMLGPIALGSIAGQQKSSGLDANGLASMLMGQKDNIAAAIPGDFAKMLGGSGLLDGLGPNLMKAAGGAAMASMASKATETVSSMGAAAQRTVEAHKPAAPSFNFMPWLIGGLGALLAYWFLFPSKPRVVALPQVPSIVAPGGVNIGNQLGSTMGTLQQTLGGIRDVGTARAALGDLQKASTDIERLGGLFNQLPADGKKSVASYLGAAMPAIAPVAAKLQGDGAMGPILKTVLDAIMGNLTRMSKG